MNLKAELEQFKPAIKPSPWRGHEHVRGYGVFGLPLSSGHVLALRVFPVNDFSPYITVWHQAPGGAWTIYYDAPRADIACPRYYGAVSRSIPAKIYLQWRGPAELAVHVDNPRIEWTVWINETPLLRLLNIINRHMPLWTWKHASLVKPREWMARGLGLGDIKLAGLMPSGHFGILMPQRMYLVERARIEIDGIDLGQPARVSPNPKIGDVALPARGIFAIGQAHWKILDEEEYCLARASLSVADRK